MTTSITITWEKMGDEFTYEIWYAKVLVGPWFKPHDIRLTDEVVDIIRRGGTVSELEGFGHDPFGHDGFGGYGEGSTGTASGYETYSQNAYTIPGLEEDTIYFIKVECQDKYHQWWYNYTSHDSIGGGSSEPDNRPTNSGGGSLGFQFNLVI